MNLWDMSISGGVLIAVTILIRGMFCKRFPRIIFLVLWLVAILRLLVPFSIPWQYSVYTLIERCGVGFSGSQTPEGALWRGEQQVEQLRTEASANEALAVESKEEDAPARDRWRTLVQVAREKFCPIWPVVYLFGAILCALHYLLSYFRWHRELRTSLPACNPQVQAWAEALPLRRKVSVRQWEGTATPLTYGALHPVILLPKALAEEAPWQLKFVLVHEYMHIRHFDAVKKMVLALVRCVHWFNPLVWAMGVLADRDMELACDECVIKSLGWELRTDYAYALIDMEEQRSVFLSLGNSFSKNAMEERVVAIMKGSRKSIAAGILSGALAAGVIMAFVTSASAMGKDKEQSQINYVRSETTGKIEGISASEDATVTVVEGAQGQSASASEDAIATVMEGAQEESASASEDAIATVMEGAQGQSASASEGAAGQDVSVNSDGSIVTVMEGIQGQDSVYSSSVRSEAIAYANDEGDACEGASGDLDLGIPEEYASLGVAANMKTGAWEYQGKKVAVFYDEGRWLLTDDVPAKEAVYLEVRRDKGGRIKQLKECNKKEMQNLLKKKGLVF